MLSAFREALESTQHLHRPCILSVHQIGHIGSKINILQITEWLRLERTSNITSHGPVTSHQIRMPQIQPAHFQGWSIQDFSMPSLLDKQSIPLLCAVPVLDKEFFRLSAVNPVSFFTEKLHDDPQCLSSSSTWPLGEAALGCGWDGCKQPDEKLARLSCSRTEWMKQQTREPTSKGSWGEAACGNAARRRFEASQVTWKLSSWHFF